MKVEIGIDERGHPVYFDFAATIHTATAGRTRSGKSVYAYVVLAVAAMQPSVRVCGVDPSGILLAPHRRSESDPLIHLGTGDPEAAVAVVEKLVAIMDKRISLLVSRGLDAVPMQAVRPEFPVHLCVLEEYPGTLAWLEMIDQPRKPAERLAPRMKSAVGRLLREGAKARVQVFTIAQRAEASTLHDRMQYARKVVFAQDNADSVRMLLDVEPEIVSRILNMQPGQGMVHEAGSPPRFFRSDMMDYETYRRLVKHATHPIL